MAATHLPKVEKVTGAKNILCSCGSLLTVSKTYGKRDDIDVVGKCGPCMMEAYNVGYADGAVTATQKSTLATIVAAMDPAIEKI